MNRDKLHRFMYELENIVDELAIIILSLGAISVTAWVLFVSTADWDIISFGRVIFPWITMLALMIIGRELWLINRKLSYYLEQKDQRD